MDGDQPAKERVGPGVFAVARPLGLVQRGGYT